MFGRPACRFAFVVFAFLSAFVSVGSAASAGEAPAPARSGAPPGEWKLVWSDEFDGGALDRKKWTFDVGTGRGGWGNRELQSYTDRADNAFVRDGTLHIRAA